LRVSGPTFTVDLKTFSVLFPRARKRRGTARTASAQLSTDRLQSAGHHRGQLEGGAGNLSAVRTRERDQHTFFIPPEITVVRFAGAWGPHRGNGPPSAAWPAWRTSKRNCAFRRAKEPGDAAVFKGGGELRSCGMFFLEGDSRSTSSPGVVKLVDVLLEENARTGGAVGRGSFIFGAERPRTRGEGTGRDNEAEGRPGGGGAEV